jgi:hypothetical protein
MGLPTLWLSWRICAMMRDTGRGECVSSELLWMLPGEVERRPVCGEAGGCVGGFGRTGRPSMDAAGIVIR